LALLGALLFYAAGLELSWARMKLCMLTPPSSTYPRADIKAVILDTLQLRSVITEEILETSWHLVSPLYLSTTEMARAEIRWAINNCQTFTNWIIYCAKVMHPNYLLLSQKAANRIIIGS
jgi:hypothetical protein